MSNQCSNLFEYRSFSLFSPFYTPLKPYPTTTLRPIFQFHSNRILLNPRRSTSRISAQSSSDKVLIATTEHQDGSFVFRFGDASEVVENDEVVEEIESQAEAEPESDVVTILDGDQETQVLVETTEIGYGSDGEILTEVDDGISNADIDSDVAARDTEVISDLRDYRAKLSETLSDIPEEEVLSLQSDAQLNNSLEGVESTLDKKTERAAQLDGDESLNPSMSLVDNSPNRDENADPEGIVLEDRDDEIEDPSVSVKLESTQVSNIEVMAVKQPYTEDGLYKVKREDAGEGDMENVMPPATMHISDVELTDAAKKDAEEGLQDMNINERTLIDEKPPSELGGEPILDDVSQLQSGHVEVEAIMEVSSTKVTDVEDQDTEDELQQVSTDNEDETDVAYVMPISNIEKAEPILEEEVRESESIPLELKPTMQVSGIEIHDTMNQDDGILQVTDQTEDPSVFEEKGSEDMNINEGTLIDWMPPSDSDPLGAESTLDAVSQLQSASVKLEANMEVSTSEGMDVENQAVEDELQQASTNNSDENDVAYVSPAEQVLVDAASQLQSDPVMLEATMEVSTSKGMDVEDRAVEDDLQQASTNNNDDNDVGYVMVGQIQSAPFEIMPTMQVSRIEGQDSIDQNQDDGILQVIVEDASENCIKNDEWSSDQLETQPVQYEGVNNDLEQCAETDSLGSSVLIKQGTRTSLLEAERIENKVSSSELAEASEDSATMLATEANVIREEIYLTGYFLSSGAALLEHPSKALTGGDDAYFVAGSKWLGMANGVGQWSFEGTDPGVYAQELMRTCEDIILDTSRDPISNPVELLCRGVKETNTLGSSSVLIANFEDQALHVANIGDTGFLIIRHGAIFKKSSPLLHEFHFSLQVDAFEDPLQLVEEHTIELDEGDIIVSATDGLFDNIYEREIATIVSKSLQAGMKPQEIANVLATRALEVGRSTFIRSPYSDAAQAAGYTGFAGGKPDNVAVIVSLVEKRC